MAVSKAIALRRNVVWVIRWPDQLGRSYYHTHSGISYMPDLARRFVSKGAAQLQVTRKHMWGPDTQIVARVKAIGVPHAETE